MIRFLLLLHLFSLAFSAKTVSFGGGAFVFTYQNDPVKQEVEFTITGRTSGWVSLGFRDRYVLK